MSPNFNKPKWLRAKDVKATYSLSDKRLRTLRVQEAIDIMPMGNSFLYSKESLDNYFAENSVKAQPQIPKMEILRKEVRSEFQIFIGGAKMPKWKKSTAGRFRHQGNRFSLIKEKGKRGVHYYLDIRFEGNGRRPTRSLENLVGRSIRDDNDAINEAYRWVTKRLTELNAATDPDITFSGFVSIYLEDNEAKRLRSAVGIKGRIMTQLEPFFGKMKLHDIRFRDLEAYRNKRRPDKVSDSTIQNELALARRLFNVAIRKELVNVSNPFSMIGELGLHSTQRERYMTFEEQSRLWPVLTKNQPMLDLADFILNTGMRPRNIINLKWDQVLWKERLIYVPEGEFKTKRDAHFVINDAVMEILDRRKEANGDSPCVFVRYEYGQPRPINRNWYQTRWNKACAEVGIKGLRFYDCKHTLGTRMAAAGISSFIIKDTMNHAQLSSTERYVKSDKTAVLKALQRMKPFLNGVDL